MPVSRLSRIAVLAALQLAAQSTPVFGQHETRPWKEMLPCKSGGHVYAASALWIDSDPKKAFAVNAVGPAVMQIVAQVLGSPRNELLIKDVELVDGFISSTGHWALVRSAHPALVAAKLPSCTADVIAPPRAKNGCPDWAYPHSTITGETVTAAVSVPVAGGALEDARKHAEEMMKMLLTLTLDAEVKVTARGTSMKSRDSAGVEDLQVQTRVCGERYWAMGIGRRVKVPPAPAPSP